MSLDIDKLGAVECPQQPIGDQYPEHVLNMQWLCENHPLHYHEQQRRKGYSLSEAMVMTKNYQEHYYNIALETLNRLGKG